MQGKTFFKFSTNELEMAPNVSNLRKKNSCEARLSLNLQGQEELNW